MTTHVCANCNGEGQVCGHGKPPTQCIALYNSFGLACRETYLCDVCMGKGHIQPLVTWQIASAKSVAEQEQLLSDGY